MLQALPPPVNSYAADPKSDLAVMFFQLPPGASYTLPDTKFKDTNRAVYVVEGSVIQVNDQVFKGQNMITLDGAATKATISVPESASEPTEVCIICHANY